MTTAQGRFPIFAQAPPIDYLQAQALIGTLPTAGKASFLIGTQVWGFNGC